MHCQDQVSADLYNRKLTSYKQAAKKKPATKAETAKPVEVKKEEVGPEAALAAGPGGKKLPKALRLLQEQQEAIKRQEEERARLDAEDRARLEEEDRRLAEEAKHKEEEKARKKQKEKDKIEQLKKEGKYLTKAQKEEKARNELKLQQMLAAGIQVGGLKDDEAPKKPSFDKKKGKGKKTDKVSPALFSCRNSMRNAHLSPRLV